MAAFFANPRCQKVFHAAENDILGLQRDYGFEFANLFDTMMAARILGWPHAGLAPILAERFGVTLDKRLQRANWGQRPLPPDLLAYAKLDTHYLLELRAQQMQELHRRGRWTEAQEGFDRLTQLQWTDKPFDPDGFWRINGVRDLSPTGLSILSQLYLFREEQARRWDRPPFKILSEHAMVAISRREPQTQEELRQIKGIGNTQVRQLGHDLLAAVAAGQALPPPRPPRRPRDGNGRPDPATEARYQALRSWRTERARARGVDPDVVLTNDILMALARQAPDSREALAATEVLAPSKLQEYGESILQVLRQA
jgi:ribonuclease D